MNQVYKVVKGKVCHEFARGKKKGVTGAVALALMGLAGQASAANTIDPPYANQVIILSGDNNKVDGELPPTVNTNTSRTTISGNDNTLVSSNSSQIFGNSNTLTNSDAPVVGESNTLTGVYGIVVGDVNKIETKAGADIQNHRNNMFVYGNGNVSTDSADLNIVGRDNNISNSEKNSIVGGA